MLHQAALLVYADEGPHSRLSEHLGDSRCDLAYRDTPAGRVAAQIGVTGIAAAQSLDIRRRRSSRRHTHHVELPDALPWTHPRIRGNRSLSGRHGARLSVDADDFRGHRGVE